MKPGFGPAGTKHSHDYTTTLRQGYKWNFIHTAKWTTLQPPPHPQRPEHGVLAGFCVSHTLSLPEIRPLLTDSRRETFQYESFCHCPHGKFRLGRPPISPPSPLPPPELNGFSGGCRRENWPLSAWGDICGEHDRPLDGTPVIIVKWSSAVSSQKAQSGSRWRPSLARCPPADAAAIMADRSDSSPWHLWDQTLPNRVELKG